LPLPQRHFLCGSLLPFPSDEEPSSLLGKMWGYLVPLNDNCFFLRPPFLEQPTGSVTAQSLALEVRESEAPSFVLPLAYSSHVLLSFPSQEELLGEILPRRNFLLVVRRGKWIPSFE